MLFRSNLRVLKSSRRKVIRKETITRSKEVNIYMKSNFVCFPKASGLMLSGGLSLTPSVEMKCRDGCVPSEGIYLCFIPSQDSRRERSSNFQAFVKMALETLLGSCRRKHGGPRGRQG